MFIVTSLEITEVLGEEALVIGAILDNGLRNRLTLRGLSSTAGKNDLGSIRPKRSTGRTI